MYRSTLRRRAQAPFRLHSLAAALAAAGASSLSPLSAQAQAPETRDANDTDADAQQKPGVLQTMKISADAVPLSTPLPPANGFKADFQQTATKMPLSVRETPQAVSIITRESLDVRQVRTLGQALELSGATQFSGNGPFAGKPSFGFNMTTIRGLEIDDLYDFRDDGFVSGSYFSEPDLAIYERVEVVKGPNSVLYGRGSVGGLVNRIRKKPQADTRTEIQATVGSYDTYRLDADTTGSLNKAQTVRGRMIGAYEDSGSFVDGTETQVTVLAPSIEFEITERTRLLLQGLYQQQDIRPNTGFPLQPTGYDAAGNVTSLDAPNIRRSKRIGASNRDPYIWRISSLQAQLDHEFNDDWFATLRLSKQKINTPIEVESYAYRFSEDDGDPSTPVRRGSTNLLGNDFDIERDVWSGEIQLNGRFDIAGRETKVAFGADTNVNDYYRRGIYYSSNAWGDPSGEYNIYDDSFERPDHSLREEGSTHGGDPRAYGVFAQAQIPVTDRLKVLAGVRFDEVELRSFNNADEHSLTQTVNDTTGRIGVTYDVNRAISLYALHAQSFQPVLYDRDRSDKLLDPERGEGSEIGAKGEWLDGKLAASTALFAIEREDVPVTVPRESEDDPFYSISGGRQRAKGFEFEINGQPARGWDVSLSYINLIDAKHSNRFEPDYNASIAGAADWQLGVYAGYEIQGGALQGLGFGVTRFEIDERGVHPASQAMIPGHERYDAHVFYKGIKDIEVNLTVRNVTDEVYVEGADRPNSYGQFGSPTAALLSVKYIID